MAVEGAENVRVKKGGDGDGGSSRRRGGIVTSKERNDWVNVGVSLRRRAEILHTAMQRESKAVSKTLRSGEARQFEGNQTGLLHDDFGNENCPVNDQKEVVKDSSREGILQRVFKTRAAVEAIQAEQNTESVSKLASFVTDEIESIRTKQREVYETLAKDEAVIFQQLKALEMRLDGSPCSRSGGSLKSQDVDGASISGVKLGDCSDFGHYETPEPVMAYDKFMQENGQTGGWEDVDHQIFLRVLKQNKSDYSRCIAGACRAMPHLSRKDIIQHARWDAERNDLLLKKHVAIKKWRMKQDEIRLRKLNEDAVTETPAARLAKMQEKVRKEDEKRLRQEQKRALEAWWKEKAEEVEVLRLKRMQQEEAKRQRQLAERAAQQARKDSVYLYRQQKIQEIEERKRKEMAEAAASVIRADDRRRTAEQLKLLQQRDNNYIQNKLSLANAAKEERMKRDERQKMLAQKLGFKADRDSSRLLRKTQSLIQREKPVDPDVEQSKMFAPVPRIQHRIIPTWRRDL